MILDADTLHALTGKRRPKAQRQALDAMGVPYRVRPDGHVVVIAADLEHRATPAAQVPAPNWAALEHRSRGVAGLF